MKQTFSHQKIKQIIKEEIQKIINEDGQTAGKLELVSTPLDKAKAYAEKKGILNDIPNFDKNYKISQAQARKGTTQRKDMPRIDDDDVKKFQTRLAKGFIDIVKPFAKTTNITNPFPQGLSGYDAKDFLDRGLRDGNKTDDIIQLTIKKVPVKSLKPIQKQIYFDISATATAQFGVEKSTKFLTGKTFFITSKDRYIIDGHHRYLSAMLIDPDMKVNILSIDLPIAKLLPLSLGYGDAIGNKRNA